MNKNLLPREEQQAELDASLEISKMPEAYKHYLIGEIAKMYREQYVESQKDIIRFHLSKICQYKSKDELYDKVKEGFSNLSKTKEFQMIEELSKDYAKLDKMLNTKKAELFKENLTKAIK